MLGVFEPRTDQEFDRGLRTPRTDQLPRLRARALSADGGRRNHVRKTGRDFTGWEDTGGIYGTDTATLPDRRTIDVFPLLNARDDRFYLLTNPERFHLGYHGLILTLDKRFSDRWQARGSYTFSKTSGLLLSNLRRPGGPQESSGGFFNFGRDPNEWINAEGNLTNERTHMARFQASWLVPFVDLQLAASYQYLSGVPWGAKARVRLPQGRISVFIEPQGTQRLPSHNILDVRLSKAFAIGNGRRLEVLVDLLNALNEDAHEFVRSNDFFSPNFDVPRGHVLPRRAMIGIKATF